MNKINNEMYREEGAYYRQEKIKKIGYCNPTALGSELMTNDNEFVNLKNIFKVCYCGNRSICETFLKTGDIKVLDQLLDKDGNPEVSD